MILCPVNECLLNAILCNSEGDAEKKLMVVHLLIGKQVDGILFAAAGISAERLIDTLGSSRVPIVVTNRETERITADFLGIDNVKGGHLAVGHLIAVAHRRIACIAGPREDTPSYGRVRGFKKLCPRRVSPSMVSLSSKAIGSARGATTGRANSWLWPILPRPYSHAMT